MACTEIITRPEMIASLSRCTCLCPSCSHCYHCHLYPGRSRL